MFDQVVWILMGFWSYTLISFLAGIAYSRGQSRGGISSYLVFCLLQFPYFHMGNFRQLVCVEKFIVSLLAQVQLPTASALLSSLQYFPFISSIQLLNDF